MFLILGYIFSDLCKLLLVEINSYLGKVKKNISRLKNKYLKLNLLIILKAHAVFNYLIEQIEGYSYLSPYMEDFIE